MKHRNFIYPKIKDYADWPAVVCGVMPVQIDWTLTSKKEVLNAKTWLEFTALDAVTYSSVEPHLMNVRIQWDEETGLFFKPSRSELSWNGYGRFQTVTRSWFTNKVLRLPKHRTYTLVPGKMIKANAGVFYEAVDQDMLVIQDFKRDFSSYNGRFTVEFNKNGIAHFDPLAVDVWR